MSAPDRRALQLRALRDLEELGPPIILCLICAQVCAARFDRTEPVVLANGERWYRDIRTWRHHDGSEHRAPRGALYLKLP